MIMFPSPAAHCCAPPASQLRDAALPPMSPAHYLQLRRKAAGRTIAQVAASIAHKSSDHADAKALVALLETEGSQAKRRETLDAMRLAFPFDPDVYRQLCEEPVELHPRICRGCGCSQWDACDEDGVSCAWSTDASCTRCDSNATVTKATHQ